MPTSNNNLENYSRTINIVEFPYYSKLHRLWKGIQLCRQGNIVETRETLLISEKLVNLVRASHKRTNCQVYHGGGAALRAFSSADRSASRMPSFALPLCSCDWLDHEGITKGRQNRLQWTLWHQLDHLDYADDLALLLYMQSQMQRKTDKLKWISRNVGLRFHAEISTVEETVTFFYKTLFYYWKWEHGAIEPRQNRILLITNERQRTKLCFQLSLFLLKLICSESRH